MLPLVVSSGTGGIIAELLCELQPSLALLTVIVSSISLFIGLTLAFMVITVYLFRMLLHGLPSNNFIVSKFLPLGPMGSVGQLR